MNKLAGIANATGIAASTLCLLHCLAMPLLLLALPALGWAAGEHLHEMLVGVALLAALLSLGPGYLTHRRAPVPLLGGAGLCALAAAVFLVGPRYGELAETALSVAGAVLLCVAHLRNRACCRRMACRDDGASGLLGQVDAGAQADVVRAGAHHQLEPARFGDPL